MADAVRETIMAALVAALEGITVTEPAGPKAVTVRRMQVRPFEAEELPAVNILDGGHSVLSDGELSASTQFALRAELVLCISATDTSAIGTRLNALYVAATTALFADSTLGVALVHQVNELELGDPDADDRGTADTVFAPLSIEIEFETAEFDRTAGA